MGGGQSTRKIGIDNDEPVGVIRVSENVAKRLKNVSNSEGNHTSSNPSFSDNRPTNSDLGVGHNPTSFAPQPSGGVVMPQFVTSSMIREQLEKELEKNDHYWERRIKNLQDNQNRITQVLEAEFNKACTEVEAKFPTLAPKDSVVPCQDYKSKVVECFKNNANHTLNCSSIVNDFTSCISNFRSKRSNDSRSP